MTAIERGITFHQTNNFREAVDVIVRESVGRSLVIPEGPPIYLFPHENHQSQHWHSPAFRSGWNFIQEVSAQLPDHKVQHMVLIDEYNNVPHGTTERDKNEKVEALKEALPLAATIFSAAEREHPHLIRNESEYVRDTQKNVCSVLDAGFQAEKLLYQLEQRQMEPRNLSSTMLLVVHPEPFQMQQRQMLQALLGRFKEGPLSRVNKKHRPALLSNMYRHVWLDTNGNITSITQPDMKEGAFVHKPIL